MLSVLIEWIVIYRCIIVLFWKLQLNIDKLQMIVVMLVMYLKFHDVECINKQ